MTENAFGPGPILVPLDGSELAEQALLYAAALAPVLRRPVVLMTAARVPESWDYVPAAGEYDEYARAKCAEYLQKVRGGLALPDVRADVRDGSAPEEVLNAARDCGASLIVAASHGRSGITRWMYGSTTSHLIRQSDVPLLVVGREPLGRTGQPPIRRIAVPLDGSPLAEAAIAPALELADALKARVTLVRVVLWAVQAYPYVSPAMYMPDLDDELESGAAKYLEGVRAGLSTPVKVDATLLRGPAAGSLIHFVESEGIDLVVMTTHGRSGLQRVVLGSTADRMLQGHAPVLLIRPADAGDASASKPAGAAVSS